MHRITDFSTKEISDFIRESNRIEGITRAPKKSEIAEMARFISLPSIQITDLKQFVKVYQPDAVLRTGPHLNVRIGNYYPPAGGPHIEQELREILSDISKNTPYETHVRYEKLHPFTDGNGRSGRAIWLWQMIDLYGYFAFSLPFLHRFYYQALDGSR